VSSNTRFGAYIDFFFNTVQTGPGATSVIEQNIGAINQYQVSVSTAGQMSAQMAMSLRRLALDFRLLSTSIRTVARELGISEGAMATITSAAVITASSITGIISAFNIYTRLTTTASGATIAFGTALGAIGAQLAATLWMLAPYIAAILAVAAAVYVLNLAFERVTGIEAYRNQLKSLEEDLVAVEDAIKAVRIEQSSLSITSAALAKAEADLDAQLKTGLITQAQYDKAMEALSIQKVLNRSATQDLALSEIILTGTAEKDKYQQEQLKKAIEETRTEAFKQLPHQIGSPIMDFLGLGGEATPAGAGGGLGGGEINLTVSLAGANIYGSEGVEEALMAGSAQMKQELEYMRRSRTSQGLR